MTTPPATHTAADGVTWEYYDVRVVHEPSGSQRRVRVTLAPITRSIGSSARSRSPTSA
jgi:hypothetical protein